MIVLVMRHVFLFLTFRQVFFIIIKDFLKRLEKIKLKASQERWFT